MADPFNQAPVLIETPAEQPDPPSDLSPDRGLVSEDPLQVFAENLDHLPDDRPEMAGAGETPAVQSEVLAFADALALPPAEPYLPIEAQHFPWMDDVLQQLVELEAAQASEKPNERPPFLDLLDELIPQAVEPDAHTSPVVASSLSEASGVSPAVAGPDVTTAVGEPPGKKWRLWLATAAVLVFAILGTLQWRSYRNRTSDGPLEVIQKKVQGLMPNNQQDADSDQPGTSAGSAETNTSSPALRTEAQSKRQDESAATNTNPSATGPDGSLGTSKTTVPASVASRSQSPPPTASNSAMGQQIGSGGKTQPSEQSSVAAYQPPTTTGSKPIVPQPAAQAAPSAIEKSKPVPQAKQDENQVAVKKTIRGNVEMAKAKNASDTAAKVAWLWKATAKGNPDAPLRLADLYIKGDIVPRSCEQAVVLLKTAAVNDNVRACNRLASMYAIGICVTRNHVKAYRWLSAALAADPNNEWAQQNRDLTWQQMTPEERALAEKYR